LAGREEEVEDFSSELKLSNLVLEIFYNLKLRGFFNDDYNEYVSIMLSMQKPDMAISSSEEKKMIEDLKEMIVDKL